MNKNILIFGLVMVFLVAGVNATTLYSEAEGLSWNGSTMVQGGITTTLGNWTTTSDTSTVFYDINSTTVYHESTKGIKLARLDSERTLSYTFSGTALTTGSIVAYFYYDGLPKPGATYFYYWFMMMSSTTQVYRIGYNVQANAANWTSYDGSSYQQGKEWDNTGKLSKLQVWQNATGVYSYVDGVLNTFDATPGAASFDRMLLYHRGPQMHLSGLYICDTLECPVTADSTPPSTSLDSPADNSWSTSKTITFTGTATEADGTLANCSLYTNETSWSLKYTNSSCTSGSSCQTNDTFTSDADYKWNYYCCDDSDNCAFNTSTNYTVRIDSTAPSITSLTPSDNTITSNTSIAFKFTATETNPSKAELWTNSSGTWTLNQTLASWISATQTSFVAVILAKRDYLWNIYINDSAGNYDWHTNYTLTIDSTPPSTSLDSPADNSWSTSKTITFTGTATEADGTLANCSLYTNETSWSLKHTNSSCSSGSTCNIAETFSTDNDFLWNYYCCDDSDNCGFNTSTNYTVRIDSTAPIISSQSINATPTINADVNFTATATNTGSGMDTCLLYHNDSGTFVSQGIASNDSSTYYFEETDSWTAHNDVGYFFSCNNTGGLLTNGSTKTFTSTTALYREVNQTTWNGSTMVQGGDLTGLGNWTDVSTTATNVFYDENSTGVYSGGDWGVKWLGNDDEYRIYYQFPAMSEGAIVGSFYYTSETRAGTYEYYQLRMRSSTTTVGDIGYRENSNPNNWTWSYDATSAIAKEWTGSKNLVKLKVWLNSSGVYGYTDGVLQGHDATPSGGGTFNQLFIYQRGVKTYGSNFAVCDDFDCPLTTTGILDTVPTLTVDPAINNTTPQTNNVLDCGAGSYNDDDSDVQGTSNWKWYDGNSIISGQTSQTLDLSTAGLDKADVIKCSEQPTNTYGNGLYYNSSNTATIQNTAPTTPTSANLNDTTPETNDIVKCTASGSSDADDDSITYHYKFNKTGTTLQNWSSTDIFDCSTAGCDDGDTVTCYARATTTDANSSDYQGQSFTVQDSTPPTFSSVYQQPTNITEATELVNLSINISDATGVNVSSVSIWWKINETNTTISCWHCINGTQLGGEWHNSNLSTGIYDWTITYSQFNSSMWQFNFNSVFDDVIRFTTTQAEGEVFRNLTKTVVINGSETIFGDNIVIVNISDLHVANSTHIESIDYRFMVKASPKSATKVGDTTQFILCNSSWSGEDTSSDNCHIDGVITTSDTTDAFGFYEKSLEATSTGYMGSLKLTSDMFFVLKCTSPNSVRGWNIHWINDTTTSSKAYTSADDGVTKTTTANSKYFVVETHYFTENTNFIYKFEASDNSSNKNTANSTAVIEAEEQVNNPPTECIITNPSAGEIKSGIITINWSESINSEDFTYNISLYNPNSSKFNVSVGLVPNGTLFLFWNTSLVSDDSNYVLSCQAKENSTAENLSSSEIFMGGNFTIDSTAPSISLQEKNATPTINADVNFTATATDPHIDTCLLYHNNSGTLTSQGVASNDSTTFYFVETDSWTAHANITWLFSCNDTIENSANGTPQSFIVQNTVPTHTTPLLNATSSNNYTTDDLTCYNQTTADDDSDTVTNKYKWFNGSTLLTAYENLTTLSSTNTSKGQVWKCEITPEDGYGSGTLLNSTALTILNTAPTIKTQNSFTNYSTKHRFNVTAEATDLDGTSDITIVNISATSGSCTNIANTTSSNDFTAIFNCTGTSLATAGIQIGFNDSSGSYISTALSYNTYPNNNPTIPSTLTPTSGLKNNSIHVICSGSTDPDSDTIVYDIQTNRTGSWIDIVADDADGIYDWDISSYSEQAGVDLQCRSDDTAGTSNYYNPAGTLSIDNTAPRWSNNLTNASATTKTAYMVYFNITWTDNNKNYSIFGFDDGIGSFTNDTAESFTSGTPLTITKTITATRGQTVSWKWYANDTLNHINETDTWSITVSNSVPTHTTPLLNATSSNNYTTDDLTCYNQSSSDADGDAITNKYKWFNGSTLLTAYENLTTLSSTNTSKGEAWKCEITPEDGYGSGTSLNSTALTILNTAPTIKTQNSFTNYSTKHRFNVTAEATDNDGASDISIVNISATSGSCTNIANTTSSNDFTAIFNCTGTALATAGIQIGFNDSSGNYVSTTLSYNNYPNNAPAITTPEFNNTTPYTNKDISANTTYTDTDSDSGTVYFWWYVNYINVWNQTIASVATGTLLISNFSSTNYSKTDKINVSVYANDGYDDSTTKRGTEITVQNSAPTIKTQNTFTNYSTKHRFNVTAEATDNDGTADISIVNISTTSGSCTNIANTTSSNDFTAIFNCTGTSLATAGIQIGFNDSSGSYISTSLSYNNYPNNAPSFGTWTYPTTAIDRDNQNKTFNWSGSDADGDTITNYLWLDTSNPPTTQVYSGTDTNWTTNLSDNTYYYIEGRYDGAEWGTNTSVRTWTLNTVKPNVDSNITDPYYTSNTNLYFNNTFSDDNDLWSGNTTITNSSEIIFSAEASNISSNLYSMINHTVLSPNQNHTMNMSDWDAHTDEDISHLKKGKKGETEFFVNDANIDYSMGVYFVEKGDKLTDTPSDVKSYIEFEGDTKITFRLNFTVLKPETKIIFNVTSSSPIYILDTQWKAHLIWGKYGTDYEGTMLVDNITIDYTAIITRINDYNVLVKILSEIPLEGNDFVQFNFDSIFGLNFYSETRTIVHDDTAPVVTYESPTPADSSRKTSNSETINVSFTEIYTDTCLLEWEGTNETMTKASDHCHKTKGSLIDGTTYNFQVFMNDSAGNIGLESARSFVENSKPATTTPSLSPATVYTTTNLNCSTTYSDAESDEGTVYFNWFKNDASIETDSQSSIATGSIVSDILNSGNYSKDDILICEIYSNDGYESEAKENSTSKTISNSAPTIQTQNTFVNCSTGHCFNITAGVSDIDGYSDITATNISVSSGSCDNIINTTTGNYFNSTWICTGTGLATANIIVGFTDASGAYISTTQSSNTYPNKKPPAPTSIIWSTTGGFTDNTLNYNQVITYVNATCTTDADNDAISCNITVYDPDDTAIINNVAMTNVSTSYTYTTDFTLNKAGTWNITIIAYDGAETNESSSTISVSTQNLSTQSGWYGCSNSNISNTAEVARFSNYGCGLIEIEDNISTLSSNWNNVLTALNDSSDQNIRVGINLLLDFNYSVASGKVHALDNISANFPDLKEDPYSDIVEYISFELVNKTNFTDAVLYGILNDLSENATISFDNKFVIFSKNYDNSNLDDSYVSYTDMLYVEETAQAGLTNRENYLLKHNLSLNRVYTKLSDTLMSQTQTYQTNIIAKLRGTTKTDSTVSNLKVAEIDTTATDMIVFNNLSTTQIITVNASNITGASGKDVWDSTNNYLIEVNTDTIINVNVSGYSATMVFFEDIDHIQLTSLSEASVYKGGTSSTSNFNYTDGTKAGVWTLYGANDARIEVFDPHYISNTFMTYYGWVNASYFNDWDSMEIIIFDDETVTAVSTLLSATTTTDLYCYVSVADFNNTNGWNEAKELEVDNCIALNSSTRLNVFVNGLDTGIGGTNFSSRMKDLVDYISITKGRKVGLNTYTAYADFCSWSKPDGFCMKESCVRRWNGTDSANPTAYDWEDWDLELEKADWYQSHDVTVLCQSFDNRTKSDSSQQITNRTKIQDIYFASLVLGYDNFYASQPDFNYAHEIYLPDAGTDLANTYSTDDNETYYRAYSNGVVYYNKTSHNGWIDDGRVINSAEICLNLVDNSDAGADEDDNLYFNINKNNDNDGVYEFTASEVAWSANGVWHCKNITTSDIATDSGAYYVNVWMKNRGQSADGIALSYDSSVASTGRHSWWDNTAGGEPYTWNAYAQDQNWMVRVTINESKKTSIDTTNKITQSENTVGAKTNVTLSSGYPFNITIWSNFVEVNLSSFTSLKYWNGTEFVTLHPQYTSTCDTNDPTFNSTTITGNVHKSCYEDTGFRVAPYGLSTQTYQALADSTPPSTSLDSPAHNSWSTSKTVTFNGTSSESGNSTLFTNETSWSGKHYNTGVLAGVSFNITEVFTADGDYKWNFYSCDNYGNCGFNTSTNYTIRIDSTTPSISSLTPADNTITSNTSIAFKFTATDTNPSKAELWTNSSGTWALNQTLASWISTTQTNFSAITLLEGDYLWNVYVNDSAGNYDWHTNYTLTIDTTAPSISSQSINATPTINADVNFTATATDTHIDTCLLYHNSSGTLTSQGVASNDSSTYYFVETDSWTAHANITHFFSCNDTIGNSANGTAQSFTVSNTVPTHTTPLLNATSSNNYTTDDLTCYNQSSSDADGDTITNKYKWFKDDAILTAYENLTTLSSTNTSKGQVWKCEITPEDGYGSGTLLNSTALTILNTPPTIKTQNTFTNYSTKHRFNVTAEATDNDGTADISIVNISATSGSCTNIANTTSSNDFTAIFNCTGTALTTAGIQIGFNDSSGSYVSTALSYNNYPNNAPTFDETINDFNISHSTDLNISVNCSDADSDTITYYDNSTLFSINSATGKINDNPTQTQAGKYRINISCDDGTVNVSTQFWYNITNTAPTTPSLTNPTNNAYINSITMNWSASTDADGDTIHYYVIVNETQACYTTDLNCSYDPAEGYYQWNVTPYDGAVNGTTSTSRYFTYDTTSPIIDLQTPSDNKYSSQVNQIFSINASDNIATTLHCQLYENFSTTWNLNYTNTSFVADKSTHNLTALTLNEGNYIWNARCNDTANNVAWNSANYSLTIDTTDPQTVFVNPTEANNSFKSQNWTFINVSINETNFANLTMDLFNSSLNRINRSIITSSLRQLNFTNLSEGVYYYNVTVVDLAGNNNETETRKITLDTTNPTKPSLITPINRSYTIDKTQFFNWTTAIETNFANYTIEISNSSSFSTINYTYNVTDKTQSNYTPTSDIEGNKTWYWRVRAYDKAGNTNTSGSFELYTKSNVIAVHVLTEEMVSYYNVPYLMRAYKVHVSARIGSTGNYTIIYPVRQYYLALFGSRTSSQDSLAVNVTTISKTFLTNSSHVNLSAKIGDIAEGITNYKFTFAYGVSTAGVTTSTTGGSGGEGEAEEEEEEEEEVPEIIFIPTTDNATIEQISFLKKLLDSLLDTQKTAFGDVDEKYSFSEFGDYLLGVETLPDWELGKNNHVNIKIYDKERNLVAVDDLNILIRDQDGIPVDFAENIQMRTAGSYLAILNVPKEKQLGSYTLEVQVYKGDNVGSNVMPINVIETEKTFREKLVDFFRELKLFFNDLWSSFFPEK